MTALAHMIVWSMTARPYLYIPIFIEIRWHRNGWDLLAHCDPPYENSAYFCMAGLPTQRPLKRGQPNFCHMLEGLRGLLSPVTILGKFVPDFYYFVSIDERPAIGSQPNLASRWKRCRFINAPQKFPLKLFCLWYLTVVLHIYSEFCRVLFRFWVEFGRCTHRTSKIEAKFGAQKKVKFWTTFSATSALNTTYRWNETKHGQTKMLVSIYNVSSTRWRTFHDLWLRNGWDLFAYCDLTFGSHFVATIKLRHL